MATAVSANDERHASSLIVALEFYPQMAIKMIHKCPSNIVLMMIHNEPNNKFMKSLKDSEKKLIPTLSTDGFNKLDMSLLYKLIRHFNLVPEPSKKWGNIPLATNINQGDDMERMRFNSNNLVHRPKGGLSEEESGKFFKETIEIACRVDNFIGESTSSFETGIRNAKIHGITQEKYRQALEKCVEFQQQLKDISGINHVDLYYGDDIAVNLGHQDLRATDSTRCTIYIRDPELNVPTIIEQLEQMKKRLNEGSYDIKLLDAEIGSLVLHVEIHNHCFITKDSLHKAIAEFLHRVFTSISGSLDQHIMEVVLTECDSYIISDNEEKNDEYLNDQEPSILKLDVMVRNTSLQSKTDLYRDVYDFINKVLLVTDKDVESTIVAVIKISQHVDEGAARTALLDDNASPFKQARTKQEDERMTEATTSRHESNYIKISMVVLHVSPRAVRVQFDKKFLPVRLQSILNKDVFHLTNLKMKKRITQPQWNLLFPKPGEQPSSKDFDITLMICLLRNLIPIDIMDKLPLATDTSLGADLSRIKYYRNIIVHCNSALVDDTDFESYWNDVTPVWNFKQFNMQDFQFMDTRSSR